MDASNSQDCEGGYQKRRELSECTQYRRAGSRCKGRTQRTNISQKIWVISK